MSEGKAAAPSAGGGKASNRISGGNGGGKGGRGGGNSSTSSNSNNSNSNKGGNRGKGGSRGGGNNKRKGNNDANAATSTNTNTNTGGSASGGSDGKNAPAKTPAKMPGKAAPKSNINTNSNPNANASSNNNSNSKADANAGNGRNRRRNNNRGNKNKNSSKQSGAASTTNNANNNVNNNVNSNANSNTNNSKKGKQGISNNKNKNKSNSNNQEKLRLERERKEAEAAAAAAEALRLQQEIEQHQLQRQQDAKHLEATATEAIKSIRNVMATIQAHVTSRQQMQNQQESRKAFEVEKKKLKSDLKKCTAFVKKIKSGTSWSTMRPEDIAKDVATLNLSRYVEEVVAALLEAKWKVADMPVVMALCTSMHLRYADFLPNLLPNVWSVIHGKSAPGSSGVGGTASGVGSSGGAATSAADMAKARRVYVRLVTEFLLHGLISEPKQLMKLIIETTGAKDKNYAVTDAALVVAFAKSAGFEVFGTRPRSIQHNLTILNRELARYQQYSATAAGASPSTTDGTADDVAEAARAVDNDADAVAQSAGVETTTASSATEEEVESPQRRLQRLKEAGPVVISDKLAQEANDCKEQMESLLQQRAVPPDYSNAFFEHCKGAHKTFCSSLIAMHDRLQKLERRCEQDRLLSGTLPEAREKGLADARKLMESLHKTVEAMSDVLDMPVPMLQQDDKNVLEGSGKGIELWTKDEDGGDGDFGPFDDEETRAFYSDIPDFLTTVPPALLGLTPEDIEKRKEENAVRYGSTTNEMQEDPGDNVEEVEGASKEQLDAAEQEESDKTNNPNMKTLASEAEEGEKDTPHYKLMVLLEQEMPECNRRDKVDEIAERFSTNHGSAKGARKRMSQKLFLVPRTRLDLLPYYSRLATTLGKVWPEVSSNLIADLEQQFHGQAKFKKNLNLESRMRTARYIGELTKFNAAPPIVSFRCLRRCLQDFTGANVDIACCLLDACGRYLYRLPHTRPNLTIIMETMSRLSKVRGLDDRSQAMIKSTFYMVKPPAMGSRKKVKVYPPLEGYLRHLLLHNLQPTEDSISHTSKQLLKFPWSDPSQECGALICRIMLKACRRGRFEVVQAVAAVAAKMRRQKPEVCIRLVDAVLEELQWSMEYPSFKDQQRTLTYVRLLGELHCASLASGQVILRQLYNFINLGHEIPEALRQASEKHQKALNAAAAAGGGGGDGGDGSSESMQAPFKPPAGITKTIQEGEEMEVDGAPADGPPADGAEESKEEAPIVPRTVAVSIYSIHDPRVPSIVDPPSSIFRIKLVCTLLEVIAKTITTRGILMKFEGFLTAFQRYLFTKSILPAEVEFSILDTFDLIDSQWRKVVKESTETVKKNMFADKMQGFPRYQGWLEAHNATVAIEEIDALLEQKSRRKLEAVAGESKVNVDDMTEGDLLMLGDDDEDDDDDDDDDDNEMLEMDDDSTVDDPKSVAYDNEVDDDMDSVEQAGDDDDDDDSNSDSSDDDDSYDEDDDDDEEDDDDDDDEEEDSDEDDQLDEEEYDEEAHMRQLEEEAFERELRRLTMDALEKGKAVAKTGKVSDTMVSGSQFIKKKSDKESTPPSTSGAHALSGKQGISFQLLKKGNKGKMEAKRFVVPTDTNLAMVATRQDDEAARERDMIKLRVLQYEAEAAESGGNLYLEQEKLHVNRNRPLSIEDIDKNFGTTNGSLRPDEKKVPKLGGNHGRGNLGGRGATAGRGTPGGRSFAGRFGGRMGRGQGRGSGGRSLV